MKILIDHTVPFVADRIPDGIDVEVKRGGDITPSDVRDADAFVVSTRMHTGEKLLKGSKVKVVATGSIGMDHIDTRWCAANGIEAVNAPGCNAPAVVQYVVCSLKTVGFDFSRQTLGVVGKGNIGGLLTAVVRRAGGRVVVCDPPREEAGFDDEEYFSLDRLLREADAVTFHVPKTFNGSHPTYHLLSSDLARLLSPDTIVVNAARGGVICEKAFLSLPNPLIIDTWEGEPSLDISIMERAMIATPHIAGYSEQGKQRAARSVIEALNRVLRLEISTDGLADYGFRQHPPTLERMLESYDPMVDSRILKSDPSNFETIRNSYRYRPEAQI